MLPMGKGQTVLEGIGEKKDTAVELLEKFAGLLESQQEHVQGIPSENLSEAELLGILMEMIGKDGSSEGRALQNRDFPYHDKFYSKNREHGGSREDVLLEKEPFALTNDILAEVKQLYGFGDIRDQISCCASVADKTFQLLKIVRKTDGHNYRKDTLHLFYQVIKRNYASRRFCKEQIDLLVEMLEKSQKTFIGEEEYFNLDERVYQNNLDVFPGE